MHLTFDDFNRKSCNRCTAWLPKAEIRDGLCRTCWTNAFNGPGRAAGVDEKELRRRNEALENLYWDGA